MKLRVPDDYEWFHCIGSACRDNCCIGWEIEIDQESYQRYQQEEGTFGPRLRSAISWQEGESPCFRRRGERCVLLNDQNLCDLILELGEGSLCQICRDHPRFTESFGGLRETGVGMCCEAAACQLLQRKEPIHFLLRETAETAIPGECEPEQVKGLLKAREMLFNLVQNRSIPLRERMCLILELAKWVQAAWEEKPDATLVHMQRESWYPSLQVLRGALIKSSELLSTGYIERMEEWLDRISRLESINEQWTERLNSVKQMLGKPEKVRWKAAKQFREWNADREISYEHLLVYFLFRYFLKAVYTGDCLTPVQLSVVSCTLIGMLELTHFVEQGKLSLSDRVQIVGLYSKQMEYSEENWSALEEAMIFDDCFSCKAISEILLIQENN